MTDDEPKVTRMKGAKGRPYELIDVPNRLAQKVGGFHVDPASIARVQARLDALAVRYPDMALPEWEKMSAVWQELRGGTGTAADDEVFRRITHDFKGQGGSVGYMLITEVATSLGELLRQADLARETARQAVDQHVATIGTILHGRIAGDGGAQGRALLAGLRLLVAKILAERTP
jgi:hypothetical protein